MTLQSSGPIRFSEIQTEFTGANPIALSEYYEEPYGLVTENNTTVPQSGTISMSNFYGTTRGIIATIESGTYSNITPADFFGTGWGQNVPKILIVSSRAIINGGLLVNGDGNLYGVSFQGTLTIRNYGSIIGTAGNPGQAPSYIPTAGGNAITVSAGSVRIENYPGGVIYGGGGGGGRGGFGGRGGDGGTGSVLSSVTTALGGSVSSYEVYDAESRQTVTFYFGSCNEACEYTYGAGAYSGEECYRLDITASGEYYSGNCYSTTTSTIPLLGGAGGGGGAGGSGGFGYPSFFTRAFAGSPASGGTGGQVYVPFSVSRDGSYQSYATISGVGDITLGYNGSGTSPLILNAGITYQVTVGTYGQPTPTFQVSGGNLGIEDSTDADFNDLVINGTGGTFYTGSFDGLPTIYYSISFTGSLSHFGGPGGSGGQGGTGGAGGGPGENGGNGSAGYPGSSGGFGLTNGPGTEVAGQPGEAGSPGESGGAGGYAVARGYSTETSVIFVDYGGQTAGTIELLGA